MKNPLNPRMTLWAASFLVLGLHGLGGFARASGDEAIHLSRPEIKSSTVQPYHPDTGIDVTTTVLDDLEYLDIEFVRIEFIAEYPPDGSINYAAYDYLVDEFQKRDIQILGLIDYQSLPHDGPDSWTTDEFRQRFVERTREIVAHYSSKGEPIRYWEIWNEQDLSVPEFDVRVPPEPYGKLLVESYHSIKKIDPKAQVVLGGISPKGFEYPDREHYLKELYETDALQEHYAKHGYHPFDIAACHPYPEVFNDPAPGPGETGLAEVMNQRFKGVMNEYGDKDKKVWITEFGWNSGHVGRKFQAEALAKSFHVIDRLTDPEHPENGPYVDQYIWFKYDSWAPSEDWGLVDEFRARRKPAYDAFVKLEPLDGAPPELAQEPGENAPVFGTTSDRALPWQVSQEDLLQGEGVTARLGGGSLAEGALALLANGVMDSGEQALRGLDGPWVERPRVSYTFDTPVTVSEIRVFAGHEENGGYRAYQSHEILINGTTVAKDVRTGNYGQVITNSEDSAVSVARWEPETPVSGVHEIEIIIHATSSWNGDFRDRWTPYGSPEKDTDGTGPAYIAPIIKEIDVFGE